MKLRRVLTVTLSMLAARVGVERVELLLAPTRDPPSLISPDTPAWRAERYQQLAARMSALPFS